jgi:quercetin dioxygenase-like cupin family protein
MQAQSWDSIAPEAVNDKVTRQVLNGEHATVARFTLATGSIVARHSHPSEQFSFVQRGALKFVFDDRETVVRGGQMIVIPSNVPHAAEALEDSVAVDFFAPRREDWLRREDAYLRGR